MMTSSILLITVFLVIFVTIEETLAFGTLPSSYHAIVKKYPILGTTTTSATTVKMGGTSTSNNQDNSEEEEEEEESNSKNLYSLLDEAVLLHSKVDNNEQEVQNLIEEIAHAMHPIEHSNKVASISTTEQQQQQQQQQQPQQLQLQKTINNVRHELDKAVVHLQTLSLQDDEEKWTKVVEQLAIEYHELVSMEKESLSSSSSESSSSSLSSSLMLASEEKETSKVSSMDEMIQGFEAKLEKLYVINNQNLLPLMMKTNDNKPEIVVSEDTEDAESTKNADNDSHTTTENIESPQEKDDTIKGTTISTKNDQITTQSDNDTSKIEKEETIEEVDVAIIGAGIGGLCAGSILNTLYDKKVGIYESHYLPGGCAHAFPATAIIDKDSKKQKVTFTFDSGPTIVLGCSTEPYNPLRQVLNAVGLSEEVEWIPYQGWGMVENPTKKIERKEIRWPVELGPDLFENGPLMQFGGEDAVKEFQELREVTKVLVSGAVEIPAMAMRSGNSALIPLLRYLPALSGLIAQGEEVTQGTFGQFMDGPKFVVKNQWLRDWLDALAFSLSGLPACRTSAAAMAYVIYDMHREGAALDYPKGGLGAVIDALVKGVEQGSNGSAVNLRHHVQSIDTSPDGSYIQGLTLKNGKKIVAKDGVICNAPVWSLNELVQNKQARTVLNNALPIKKRSPRQTWTVSKEEQINKINYIRPPFNEGDADSLLAKCDSAEMTGSFLHLHLAIDAKNLDLDSLEAHYTGECDLSMFFDIPMLWYLFYS